MQLADERQAVVQACRDLVATGLVRGTSGNVSIRDPASGLVVITPSGAVYDTMTPGDVAVLT
ncbi:MAG: class II aldolase/adducin family protein, partial [Actinomycetota bacterium]|nr:class II aldolase/adducin family protein [Actinomycetota bacterium]